MAWMRPDVHPQTKELNVYAEVKGQKLSINREALTTRM
jgi:hypothetical protein